MSYNKHTTNIETAVQTGMTTLLVGDQQYCVAERTYRCVLVGVSRDCTVQPSAMHAQGTHKLLEVLENKDLKNSFYGTLDCATLMCGVWCVCVCVVGSLCVCVWWYVVCVRVCMWCVWGGLCGVCGCV